MFNKLKIYLSYYVYFILIHDMYSFEIFKPNGDINKNDFLNVLIYNFYQDKLDKKEKIKNTLLNNAIPINMNKDTKANILQWCTDVIDEIYNEDPYRYHDCYFMFYPSRKILGFFNKLG